MFSRSSCTRAVPWPRLLGGAALVLGLGLSPNALAVQASGAVSILPSDNTLEETQIFSAVVRVTNTSTETGAEGTAAVPAQLSGQITVTLACTTSDCTTQLPDTLDFINPGGNGCLASVAGVSTCAGSGENQVLVTIGAPIVLPAGGFVDVAVVQLQAKNPVLSPASGEFFQRAATGANDILAVSIVNPGSPVTGGASGSTSYLFPGTCDVRVDKQVSCDGGVTWIDPGLVNENEDGTNACQGLSTSQILVRYQVSNVGDLDASGCTLTESNPAFGNPAFANGIAAGSTSGFIPGANAPLCSAAQGNEPNTATLTCANACGGVSPGDPRLTASDSATFSCLVASLQTDRAVDCAGDAQGFVDQTLVTANEDGTNGPSTLNGQQCAWQYQANNNGTAPLFDCVLLDSNPLVSPSPISVGDLAPGQLVSAIPATNTQLCSDTLEASENPGGRVDLTCCTADVATIADCADANRVQVFDIRP